MMPTVRLPDGERFPEAELGNRTQLMHDFGALLLLWNEFELAVEVKIAALSGMQPRAASIVLSPIMFGTKSDILSALLRDVGDEAAIKPVMAVIQAARRNALVHSVACADPTLTKFSFARREIKGGYKVNQIEFDADSFHRHYSEFRVLVRDAMLALGFTSDDYAEEYGRKAGFYWPDQ